MVTLAEDASATLAQRGVEPASSAEREHPAQALGPQGSKLGGTAATFRIACSECSASSNVAATNLVEGPHAEADPERDRTTDGERDGGYGLPELRYFDEFRSWTAYGYGSDRKSGEARLQGALVRGLR
jgi:hypothetical protein